MSNTANIYRFEGADGRGLWQSMAVYHARKEAGYRHNPGSGPPPDTEYGTELTDFWCEARTEERNNFFFGFKSVEQLKNWPDFGDHNFLKVMTIVGVKLLKYEVPQDAIKHGNMQLIFDKTKAVKVCEYKPMDVLKRDCAL